MKINNNIQNFKAKTYSYTKNGNLYQRSQGGKISGTGIGIVTTGLYLYKKFEKIGPGSDFAKKYPDYPLIKKVKILMGIFPEKIFMFISTGLLIGSIVDLFINQYRKSLAQESTDE